VSQNGSIRDRIANNDVTVMRSYLEVDIAEWFSDNEMPFGYEAFVIPSVVGPGKDRWDEFVDAIRNVGEGERDSIELPTGETMDAFEILSLWNDIYEKHKLAEERVTIDPNPSLAGFSKRMILPDFALYPDASVKTAGDEFDWGNYEYIVEVSGLYGVGLPGEAEETDWWDWYRVSAVAFKELAYRLLGLWEDVYWVIPNQAQIEGVTDGIPLELRNDPHYIVLNTTQTGVEVPELADAVGITQRAIDSGLSPIIQPTKYQRPLDTTTDFPANEITPVEYKFDSVNFANVEDNEKAVIVEGDYVVYHGDMGEVYVHDGHAHVRESQWRGTNMMLIREYVLDALSDLAEDGIVEGLSPKGGET